MHFLLCPVRCAESIKYEFEMAETWRQRHQRQHWTKRIDISYLYQLEMISGQMKKRAEEQGDKELLEWAQSVRLIVARANGEELNISLTKHQIKRPSVVAKD